MEQSAAFVAFLRAEKLAELEFRVVAKERLVAILPSDHRLAQRKAIDPHDLVGETYIGVSKVARVLRGIIADYFKRCKIEITPSLEVDNYAMAISLVASTRRVALLPASARYFLPWSVVRRPLKGEVPTIDVAVGYHKANASPILKGFPTRLDSLTATRPGEAGPLSGSKYLRR
jgi:LysR family transcriptional regulator, hca operon transcriptional activator